MSTVIESSGLRWSDSSGIRTEECHLLLSISESGIQSSVLHIAHDHVLWSGSEEFEAGKSNVHIVESLRKNYGHHEVFRKTTIILNNPLFSLVPSAFFSEEKAVTFHSFNHELKGGPIRHHRMALTDIVLTYEIEKSLADLFEQLFPEANQVHHAETCISYALRIAGDSSLILLSCEKSHALITVVCDGQLKICNSYPVTRHEDVLYYLANAAVRSGLDLESVLVVASGKIEEDDAQWLALKAYCGNMSSYSKKEELRSGASTTQASFPISAYLQCE